MSRVGQLILLGGLTLTLSDCATLSKDECQNADWRMIGYEDGAKGREASKLGQHREACADHGITPDMSAYLTGRDQGLEQYCTGQRGFNEGRDGESYEGVCPANLEDGFLYGYEAGRLLYLARKAVKKTDNAIHDCEQERERLQAKIEKKEALVISDESTSEERAELLRDIKRLQKRYGKLGEQIRGLEGELALRQATLDELRRHSPYP